MADVAAQGDAGAQAAYVARRRSAHMEAARLTNFYPLYDGANDQVDRVSPVRRTIFQRVIPRYELSTSETRDEGVGPTFIEVPSMTSDGSTQAADPIVPRTTDEANPPDMRPPGPLSAAPLPPWMGRRIDLFV
jgi:hypothetical protein